MNELYKIIPDFIYGENEESLEMVIGKLLKADKKTVSTAESCTGGQIAHLITSVPGSSEYYKGSVIAYSNSVKTQLLGVQDFILTRYGAVSENTAKEMAVGARSLLNTDYAIATTGIAGPDGATEAKPIGTVWIAVAGKNKTITKKFQFGNKRAQNIERSSINSLSLLYKLLKEEQA